MLLAGTVKMVILLFMVGVAVYQAAFGQGADPVLLRNVECTGTESSLLSCNPVETLRYCPHSQDAGVICPSCKPCIWVQIVLTSELLSQ